ncbi:LAGLIDADG family homing endonuclease [Streptomyces sp. O3]
MATREPSAHQPSLDDALRVDTAVPFMDLEDPAYAYMFGFLQMDGHLAQGTGRKGRLTVEINARDVDILREFQRLTPYNSTITERTRSTNFAEVHHSATWTLCTLEARTTINRLGLPYGRKSATISPPSGPFSDRDYLRGVIDADGSVGYTRQGLPFISLTTASSALAAYMCHYAQQVTSAERHVKRNARDGIFNILYMKEPAMELAEHLYYPDCLALARKRLSAASLAAWVRPTGMKRVTHRRWKSAEDMLLLELNDPAAAAIRLNRTENSCSLRLWRLRSGRVPMPTQAPPEL